MGLRTSVALGRLQPIWRSVSGICRELTIPTKEALENSAIARSRIIRGGAYDSTLAWQRSANGVEPLVQRSKSPRKEGSQQSKVPPWLMSRKSGAKAAKGFHIRRGVLRKSPFAS